MSSTITESFWNHFLWSSYQPMIGHSISQGWYWSCPQGVPENWDFLRNMGLFGANSGIGTWAMKSSPSMSKFVDMIQAQVYVYIFCIYWCLNPHGHGGRLHIYLYMFIQIPRGCYINSVWGIFRHTSSAWRGHPLSIILWKSFETQWLSYMRWWKKGGVEVMAV